jgi:hypothetical protein
MKNHVEKEALSAVRKKTYRAPYLQEFGAVKDLTASGSRAVPEPELPPDANPNEGMA